MVGATVTRIDVWSDYVCPYCYLQFPALKALQQKHESWGRRIEIVWRAFELRPEPIPTLDPVGEYLRSTWATSVYPMAEARGMNLKLPPVQPRSRAAHEAAAFAQTHGRFDAMHEALFRAFFEEGRDIGRNEVLAEIAGSVGLDPRQLTIALEEKRFSAMVEEDQQLALRLGVSGVPIMTLRMGDSRWEEALALQGAVPYEHMEAAADALLKQRG